jgi:hypothetical protein
MVLNAHTYEQNVRHQYKRDKPGSARNVVYWAHFGPLLMVNIGHLIVSRPHHQPPHRALQQRGIGGRDVRDPLAHPVRLTRSQPPNGSHQGTMIPWSQCHKPMICMIDGGPARTRTWDQGIMSNRISSLLLQKAEEA